MHRGHQFLLTRLRESAAQRNKASVLLTFEPHPRDFLTVGTGIFRLTPLETKARLAHALNLDGMVVLPFDHALAQLSPELFVREILVRDLQAAHLAVGADFHYGAGRTGNAATLIEAGGRLGFSVDAVPSFSSGEGPPVSSSRIRLLLEEGRIPEAADLLGYHWFFEAEVVHGDKRGRELGYPTANVHLPPENRLAHGIYAVLMTQGGNHFPGVASFGRRPTFDNGAVVFETHIFDFSGDLYGTRLRITPIAYLRPERRFSSVAALIQQMDRDSLEARSILSHFHPLSPLDQALLYG